MIIPEDGQYIGTCEHCGDESVRVGVDDDRCEDCYDRYVHCSVCEEEQFEEDACRHVFRDERRNWVGSGIWTCPELKAPLFRLFDLLPGGFAVDLRAAIKTGTFYTFLVAPLIGSGGTLELHGMPDREYGFCGSLYWSEAFLEIGSNENHGEETADGYHWLASLYTTKTLAANRQTIKWIDDYLKLQRETLHNYRCERKARIAK